MKTRILILFCLSTLIGCAFADSVFYVRPGAEGANNGSSWTNAFSKLPNSLLRGGTYYLADGNYTTYAFNSPESGGQNVVVKKATAADHGTEVGWQTSFGDGAAEFSAISFETDSWVLDGGGRSAPTAGYGIKVANAGDMIATVTIPGKRSNVTLRYVELAGDPILQNRGAGIYAVQGPSNLLVQHCYLHDFFGVPFHLIDASKVTIEYSLIARNKSTAEWHSEAIQARGCTDLIVRYNTWEDINGTAVIVSGSGNSSRWGIYGNIFNRGNVGHGIVSDNMVDSIGDVTISGNVIIGHQGNAGMNFYKATGRITVVDNVWFDNPWVSFIGITTRDYNYYSKCRFPYAFQPSAHESPVKDGPDGKYSVENKPPFADWTAGNFTLSPEALQTMTREKK